MIKHTNEKIETARKIFTSMKATFLERNTILQIEVKQ